MEPQESLKFWITHRDASLGTSQPGKHSAIPIASCDVLKTISLKLGAAAACRMVPVNQIRVSQNQRRVESMKAKSPGQLCFCPMGPLSELSV